MSKQPLQIDSALLRRLHSLHEQREDLQGQLRRGPQQIAAAQAIVDRSVAKQDAAEESVKLQTRIANEKQKQLGGREAKVAELSGKLNTAASNKEFTLLQQQIAADVQANDCLGDEILEVLEKIDELNAQVDAAAAEVKEHQEAKAERETKVQERLKIVEADLSDVLQKLAVEEEKLPATARPLYDRLVKGLGVEAMAELSGNTCGNCNQTLRTQIIDHLAMGHLLQCPSCNALLYKEN